MRASEMPPVLFDGYAVYQALTDDAKKRTSHENVSDVLDAVVRLLHASASSSETGQQENGNG
jgi:hypothetical protein